jgi:dodecin
LSDVVGVLTVKATEYIQKTKEVHMAGSVYKIIEVVGTSATSWEEAVKSAVETAAKGLEDLRIAEVVKQDVTIESGKVTSYRARVTLSFKYRQGKD